MSLRTAQVRFYVDADILGLGKILGGLRNDVTLWGSITGSRLGGLAGWDHRWVIISVVYLLVRCLLGLSLPKISSSQVGAAIRFRRQPHELDVLRRSRLLRHDDRLCCFDWPIWV
jgi:hypothetical protein